MKPIVAPHLRNRRVFLGSALASLAGGALASLPARAAESPAPSAWKKASLKGISPADVPTADVGYTQGILCEPRRILYVSGKGPDDLKADMETQFRQTFRRIEKILKAGGASLDNVVIIRSYFLHIERDLPIFRKVRREFLSRPYPASTALGISALAVPGLEFEIEATAVL